MDGLDRYLVVLSSGLMYLYWAEDTQHAIEQMNDEAFASSSDETILEVYKCELVWDAELENG